MKRATFDGYLHALERKGWRGALLDVGCGAGFLIERALECGWDAHGIELSAMAAEEARRLVGENRVAVGVFEDVELPRSEFDAITMVDFIEHVLDPRATLQRARSLLQPGGALMLTTPFVGSFSYYLMGRRWSQFKDEHLQYFSRRSVSVALDQAGFEVLQLSSARKRLSLDYVSRHMEFYPHPRLTPLVGILRRLVGGKLAHHIFTIPAGDLLALARRDSRELSIRSS